MKERCFCIFFFFSLFLIFTLFLIRSLTVLSFVQFRRRTRRRVKEKKNFQQKLKKCWNTSNSSRSFNFYSSRSSLPFLIFYSLNPYFFCLRLWFNYSCMTLIHYSTLLLFSPFPVFHSFSSTACYTSWLTALSPQQSVSRSTSLSFLCTLYMSVYTSKEFTL